MLDQNKIALFIDADNIPFLDARIFWYGDT